MAKTISSLAVKLAMETDGLTKGAKLTRSELAEVRSAYKATTSPVDELDAQVKTLTSAFDKGAIPLERYNARLAELNTQLRSAKQGASPFAAAAIPRSPDVAGFAGSQAAGMLPGFAGQLESAASAAGPAGVAIAAAAVVAAGGIKIAHDAASAFAAEMKTQFATIDQWTMQAKEMGLKTESFAIFDAMSDDVRMSTEEIGGTIQKMQQRLGAAAFGGLDAEGGKLGKTLGRIGLSVDQLVTQKPDQQLRTIAEAISQLPSDTEKAAAAFDIFGKQGQKMLPALEGGARGIDEYAAKSETLRQALSKSEGVAALDSQIDDLNRTWRSLAATATVEVAPALADALKAVNEFAGKEEFVHGITGAFRTLAEAITITTGVAKAMADSPLFTVATGGLRTVLGTLTDIGKATAEAAKKQRELDALRDKRINPRNEALEAATAQVKALAAQIQSLDEAGSIPEKKLKLLADAAERLASKGADVSTLTRSLAEARAGNLADDLSKTIEKIEEFNGKLRDEIATWGMVGKAAEIAGMKRHMAAMAGKGATDEQLAKMREQIAAAETLNDRVDELKDTEEERKRVQGIENKRIDDAAKYRELNEQLKLAATLFPKLKAPDAEALGLAKQVQEGRKERDRIQELLATKLIAPDVADAALKKIQRDLDAAFAKRHILDVRLPEALMKDSAELGKALDERRDLADRKKFAENAEKAPQLEPLVMPQPDNAVEKAVERVKQRDMADAFAAREALNEQMAVDAAREEKFALGVPQKYRAENPPPTETLADLPKNADWSKLQPIEGESIRGGMLNVGPQRPTKPSPRIDLPPAELPWETARYDLEAKPNVIAEEPKLPATRLPSQFARYDLEARPDVRADEPPAPLAELPSQVVRYDLEAKPNVTAEPPQAPDVKLSPRFARYDLEATPNVAANEPAIPAAKLPSEVARYDLEARPNVLAEPPQVPDAKLTPQVARYDLEARPDIEQIPAKLRDLESMVARYDLEMPSVVAPSIQPYDIGTTATTPSGQIMSDDRVIGGLAQIKESLDKLRDDQAEQFREQQRSDADSIVVEEVSIV